MVRKGMKKGRGLYRYIRPCGLISDSRVQFFGFDIEYDAAGRL